MTEGIKGKPRDPNLASYTYTADPLVEVRNAPRKRGKIVAKVLLGEWMKLLPRVADDGTKTPTGWEHVKYRGGTGYVESGKLSYNRTLEIFFIDVDQGDSILIQTPDDRRILIDGGRSDDAHRFLRNKYRLDKKDNYIDFEAVVATHSDNDHTGGLIKILRDKKILVKSIYHNGLFPLPDQKLDGRVGGRVETVVDGWPAKPHRDRLTATMKRFLVAAEGARDRIPAVVKAMKAQPRWKGRVDFAKNRFVFKRLDATDGFLPPYDAANSYATIRVLWPRVKTHAGSPYLPWYGSFGETVNGHSVVLSIEPSRFDGSGKATNHRILLTGDLNEKSMDDLEKVYSKKGALRSRVYKAAHHGSQHFSVPFLRELGLRAAVISSGDDRLDQHGHPRAVLLGTVTRYADPACERPAVFSTELAACHRKLTGKELKEFKGHSKPLYERAIQGIVHLRWDGERMVLGTVHGRKPPEADAQAATTWKWDVWPDEHEE